jgi:hypothetical protein
VQNAFVESFNGRLRDELLNETLFASLPQARAVRESWRCDYNTERPHSSLDWQTPLAFATKWHGPRAQWDRALSRSGGFAPCPIASNAQITSNDSNFPLAEKRGTGQWAYASRATLQHYLGHKTPSARFAAPSSRPTGSNRLKD